MKDDDKMKADKVNLEIYLNDYDSSLIKNHTYGYTFARIGVKSTVCALVMKNGYEVIGTSAPVNPEEFDYTIGRKCALIDAIKKADQLVGYDSHRELMESK